MILTPLMCAVALLHRLCLCDCCHCPERPPGRLLLLLLEITSKQVLLLTAHVA